MTIKRLRTLPQMTAPERQRDQGRQERPREKKENTVRPSEGISETQKIIYNRQGERCWRSMDLTLQESSSEPLRIHEDDTSSDSTTSTENDSSDQERGMDKNITTAKANGRQKDTKESNGPKRDAAGNISMDDSDGTASSSSVKRENHDGKKSKRDQLKVLKEYEDPICRTCWRYAHQTLENTKKPFFRCTNCAAFHHLKCDTASTNLVQGGNGILVGPEVPLKDHQNWCHLCQRIANKLENRIFSYSNLIGTKSNLKSLLRSILVDARSLNVNSKETSIVINHLLQQLNSDTYSLPDQLYFDLIEMSEKEILDSRNLPQCDEILNSLKFLIKLIKQELCEAENCYECYIDKKENFKDFLKPCTYPHFLVWVQTHNLYWPAKLMTISDKFAYVIPFHNKVKMKVTLNRIMEFSLQYPHDQDEIFGLSKSDQKSQQINNVLSQNIRQLINNNSSEIVENNEENIENLQLALNEVNTYLMNCKNNANFSKNYIIKQEPTPITNSNCPDYSIFSCVDEPHIQVPSYMIKMQLESMSIKDVEGFSMRSKCLSGSSLPTYTQVNLSKHVSNSIDFITNTKNLEKEKINSVEKKNLNNGSSSSYNKENLLKSDSQKLLQTYQKLVNGKNFQNVRVLHSDAAYVSDKNLNKRQKIDFSNFSNISSSISSDIANNCKTIKNLLEDSTHSELLNAEFISGLRANLMQSISREVDNFCFEVFKNVSSILNNNTGYQSGNGRVHRLGKENEEYEAENNDFEIGTK